MRACTTCATILTRHPDLWVAVPHRCLAIGCECWHTHITRWSVVDDLALTVIPEDVTGERTP